MMASRLSPRQLKFVNEYLKSSNASQAAIAAGYSKKAAKEIGSRLLTNANIRDYLSKGLERLGITPEYVLAGIKELAERCMQRVPVMVRDPNDGRRMIQKTDDETGEGVWEFDSAGANKALENLGKYLKLFTDKVEHSGKMSHDINEVAERA